MKRMRNLLAVLFAMLLALVGCTSKTTEPASTEAAKQDGPITITDMNGRTVELPKPAEKAFGAGPPATVMLYTFDDTKLGAWNNPVSEEQSPWLTENSRGLPAYGRASTKGGNFNPEVLLQNDIDVIIDAGDMGDQYRAMADDLQQQTGIPVIQLSTDLDKLGEAYQILGQVFGNQERANELTSYVIRVNEDIARGSATIPASEQVSVYYATGDNGLSTAGSGSIHSRIIELVGATNIAGQAEKASGRVEVNAEQIIAWNPDWVIASVFKADSTLATNPKADPTFGQLTAVQEGRILISVTQPYGWMDGPPSVNQVLGVMLVAEELYPDYYDFDLDKEVKDFYKTFYHYDLSDDQVKEIRDSIRPVK